MNDNEQAGAFDPEEAGRIRAQELIRELTANYHTNVTFAAAIAQVRRALLDVLDSVDPDQIIEAAWKSAIPEAVQFRLAEESDQRRKERGSLQDPMYPPELPKRWD